MSKNGSLRGTLDLLVLQVLSRHEKISGYAIAQRIESDSIGKSSRDYLGFEVEGGSFYPALRRLEKAQWIRGVKSQKNGRPTRNYELTTAGKKKLAELKSEWKRFSSAVERVLAGS